MFYVGGETWSLALREEHRLGGLESRVLRGVFGGKREEVTGDCRRLHCGERYDITAARCY